MPNTINREVFMGIDPIFCQFRYCFKYIVCVLAFLFKGGPGLAVQLSFWGTDKNVCSDKKQQPC